jgi:UDPglucose 6-dehydrogenase
VARGSAVARQAVVVGRCVLDPARWRAAGWRYRALGRAAAAGGAAAASPAA